MTNTTPVHPTAVADDDVALQELVAQLEDLNSVVNSIVRLRSNNTFRFLSKATRNTLLYGMLEKAGDVQDAAKAAFRVVKKNKREALPPEVADAMVAASAGLRPIAIKEVAAEADAE